MHVIKQSSSLSLWCQDSIAQCKHLLVMCLHSHDLQVVHEYFWLHSIQVCIDSWCDVMKLCHMWWLCWFTTIYHSYQCRIMIILYPFNWINYHLFVQGESQLDHLPLMRFKDADIMEQHKILRMDFLNVTLPFLLLLWNIAVIMAPWLSSWGNVMHIFHGHSIWSNS